MHATLAMLKDDSVLLRRLLEGGHSQVSGRMAGAFRNIGRDEMADSILETMRVAGYSVYERDPFTDKQPNIIGTGEISPHVNRLRMTWVKTG